MFQATTGHTDEMVQDDKEPLVSRPAYRTPTQILARPKEKEETKKKEIKKVNEKDRRRSQSPSPCIPVENIHKTEDEDQDRTNMLFEQDRARISVNEVIRDRSVPLHRPYSCQSDGCGLEMGCPRKGTMS